MLNPHAMPSFRIKLIDQAIEGRLNDDRIIYTSDKRILKVMRFMIALVAPGSLLIPVIALYGIRPQWARLFAIVSFTLLFSTLLTVLTRAKPSDIFAATAAYVQHTLNKSINLAESNNLVQICCCYGRFCQQRASSNDLESRVFPETLIKVP